MDKVSLGINGTNINKILEGTCVIIIVKISPTVSASFAANNALIPATILHTNKTKPIVEAGVLYTSENHSEIND